MSDRISSLSTRVRAGAAYLLREDGQSLVEYGLILPVLSVAVIAAELLTGGIRHLLSTIASAL